MPSAIALSASSMTTSGRMLRMWFRNDMNASRPSRATTTYDASGNHGIPSAGVWVLADRRWVWASRPAMISSRSWNRASIHGASSRTGAGGSPGWNSSVATIVCVHVVPHFGGVQTKMSPGRCVNRYHRRLSEITLR